MSVWSRRRVAAGLAIGGLVLAVVGYMTAIVLPWLTLCLCPRDLCPAWPRVLVGVAWGLAAVGLASIVLALGVAAWPRRARER